MQKDYSNFRSAVLHLQDKRNHAVTDSLGVYDAYKYIRKNGWFDIGRPIKEHEFYSIVRKINSILADSLIAGEELVFPCRMGKLELRKRDAIPSFNKDGSLRITYPVDWDSTLKLWYEDEDSYNCKTLVRIPEKEVFKVHYNKCLANFNNKGFMDFRIYRDIKTRLKQSIKNNRIDAFGL